MCESFDFTTKKILDTNTGVLVHLSNACRLMASGDTPRIGDGGADYRMYCAGTALYDLSLRAVATASSSAHGGAPSRAIDGNANSHYENSASCTHTNTEYSPWWQVTVPDPVFIAQIRITNRGDCCGDRLSDFTARVDGEACVSNGDLRTTGATKTFDCGLSGTDLRITAHGSNKILNFCEVEIRAYEE
jgi:hypothetical protein